MQKVSGESSYRRYLNGDAEAFDEIINLYKKGLIGFILRYVGDYDTAEDISEDCFVELIVSPGKYKFKSSLKTYLYGIARNKAVGHFRRNKSGSFISLEDAGELVSSLVVEDEAVRSEDKEMLGLALTALPKDYREVLELHYFEGLSYEEIGRVMKKSPKAVYNLAFRAKHALKEKLEKDGFIYEEP